MGNTFQELAVREFLFLGLARRVFASVDHSEGLVFARLPAKGEIIRVRE